jgi:hypothetical protein
MLGEQDVLHHRYPSPSNQRQLYRLAMEIWQLSPFLRVMYVPFTCREMKPTNIAWLSRVYRWITVLSTRASETAVAKQNTAVFRQPMIVALNRHSCLRQQPGVSRRHHLRYARRQCLLPHHPRRLRRHRTIQEQTKKV